MEKSFEKLYSKRETYSDDESYWYYDALVVKMSQFPSVFLELHTSYNEDTGKTRKGYTLIEAGEIPKPFYQKRNDDVEIEVKVEIGEENVDEENLGEYCPTSWVGGKVIQGVDNYLQLYGHPELMDNNQEQRRK